MVIVSLNHLTIQLGRIFLIIYADAVSINLDRLLLPLLHLSHCALLQGSLLSGE